MPESEATGRDKFPANSSLPFGPRPALIVIDVCDAYLDPASPMYVKDRFANALTSVEKVIELFRSTTIDAPIIFTKISLPSPTMGGKWFTEKIPNLIPCFEEGSQLGDYPSQSTICRCRGDKSTPQEFELVKQFASSFFGTPLASMLISLGVDTLVIVGFSTSGCVRATALDAIQYGFRPFVVKEACGDRDQATQDSNLYDIQAKIGEVIAYEQLSEKIGMLERKQADNGKR